MGRLFINLGFGTNLSGSNEAEIPGKGKTINITDEQMLIYKKIYYQLDLFDNEQNNYFSSYQNHMKIFDRIKRTDFEIFEFIKDFYNQNETTKINTRKFKIPLYFSTIGRNISYNNYKYIPLKYFKDLTIQVKLNRFAFISNEYFNEMFTEVNKRKTINIENRNYKIKSMKVKFKEISVNAEIENYVDEIIKQGKWVLETDNIYLIDKEYPQTLQRQNEKQFKINNQYVK